LRATSAAFSPALASKSNISPLPDPTPTRINSA
jgi:hypothetical protein